MVSLTELAYNQLQSIVSQYGDYRNAGEFGRSAFWLWHDQIVNATRKVNVSESKKVSSTLYCYTIPYWGVIYFTNIRVRKNGRFNGIHIIVKEYNFDVENFYRWIKHEELIPIRQQTPRTINKRFKPRNAGFGFRIVRSSDGLYNYINNRNELLSPTQWFKEVKPFKKTKQGILAFVNNNGICNAIDSNGTIYDMNRSWKDCFTEGKIKKDIMTEAINKISNTKRIIRLTESELKGIITESVKQVIKTLNESEVDNSYKPIGGGHKFTDKNGTEWTSVMTIKAPSGQMCHFVEDDHCYLLFNDDGEGKNCSDIKWIFPEAFEALKSLPPL